MNLRPVGGALFDPVECPRCIEQQNLWEPEGHMIQLLHLRSNLFP